jgi:hypothetical protein
MKNPKPLRQKNRKRNENMVYAISYSEGRFFEGTHLSSPSSGNIADAQRRLFTKVTFNYLYRFTTMGVYVGLSYYAPALGGDEFLNFFLAGLAEMPTYLFLYPCLHHWGRRWTLFSSLILGGIACIATISVKDGKTRDIAICNTKLMSKTSL